MGAYSGTYASSDLGPITIDAIGTIGVVFVSLASIIGLVILFKWLKGKVN